MQIRIEFFAQAVAAAGTEMVSVEIPVGSSVQDAVLAVVSANDSKSELKKLLLNHEGALHAWILASVNGVGIAEPATHMLKPGDVLQLLPPISGG